MGHSRVVDIFHSPSATVRSTVKSLQPRKKSESGTVIWSLMIINANFYITAWVLYHFQLYFASYWVSGLAAMQCFSLVYKEHTRWGVPWWLSGKESVCQCRRHRFNLWSRKISHGLGATKPVLHNYWAWMPRTCALQQEIALKRKAHAAQQRVAPVLCY